MSLAICRVCEGNEELEFIFNNENPSVAYKLMICSDIEIEYDDPLPKYICLKCQQNLDLSYLFRIQCETTDRKLRKIYTSAENISETDEKSKELEYKNNEDYLLVSDQKEEEEEYLLEEYEDVEELADEEASITESVNSNTEEAILYEELETTQLVDADCSSSVVKIIRVKDDPESYSSSGTFDDEDGVEESFNGSGNTDNETIVVEYDIEASSKKKEINDTKECKRAKSPVREKFFRCDTCGESCATFVEFNLHKKSHGEYRYQCPVCKKWFSKRYRLKNHMAVHEQTKSYCCEICGNKYTNQGNLDRHIRHFHKKERPYMCSECGLSFSRSNILKLHYTVHINERNHECEICNKRFKAEYYLNLHKKSHLPVEERRPRQRKSKTVPTQPKTMLSCSFCGKKFATKTLYTTHIRIHTGEKPFECKTCNRKFAFRQSLKSHELLHTGEKPYRCEVCGFTFRQIGHLKGHMLVHSGVKQHKCQFCDKAFSLKSNLVVHQRLHTGETPYHCNLCNKKFYDSNGLKRHKHSHLKRKKEMQEMQEIQNLVGLEPIKNYFEEKEEYAEITEMQTDEEIRLVDLGECQ